MLDTTGEGLVLCALRQNHDAQQLRKTGSNPLRRVLVIRDRIGGKPSSRREVKSQALFLLPCRCTDGPRARIHLRTGEQFASKPQPLCTEQWQS